MANEPAEDPRADARDARAERYFTRDLRKQREWYSNKASGFKKWAELLSIAIIAGGALTTFLQVFPKEPWIPIATAALGGLITIAEGWQRIARYRETWIGYRTASERMKQERRLFVNAAGRYTDLGDDEAFRLFVETVEAIIAEEQQIYWQARASPSPKAEAAPADGAA